MEELISLTLPEGSTVQRKGDWLYSRAAWVPVQPCRAPAGDRQAPVGALGATHADVQSLPAQVMWSLELSGG